MTRSTRLVLFSLIGAGLIGFLLWLSLRPVPVSVDLVPVTRGPMEVTIEVDAVTRIREVWEVSAPITGTADRSPVRVGDMVVAGVTLVARVEPVAPSLLDLRSRTEAEAAVQEAEAALAVAQSQLVQAEADLVYAQSQVDRAQALADRGVASIVQLENAMQARDVAQAARNTAISSRAKAQSTLDRARAALIGPETARNTPDSCCVQITAPADGVVLSIDQISERPVTAGQRLLTIGDPSDLEIVADPLSRDAVRIPASAMARVTRWGGDTVLEARLRQIDPVAHTEVSALGIEEQRVEAIFDFLSPAAQRPGLGDGYALRLEVIEWQAPDVLAVPLGALFRQGGDWAVFVDDGGLARLRTVTLGRRNDMMAEVLSGLSEGEQVVSHPGDMVIDGALLTPATRQ
ncbi:efflux RND transporter periplasmic adaptor subunit [Tropicibacter oceani]|uniref:HlyD family efflux transporter periplasmic adaptor subunit n=1 Tax=Tropicibacter oceani TaxID=3058420 RepID=A0ABY8QFP0_9RHOB|nr:HlyD family efflux transporter periplasmic adaptor subunit [Tropicibacter oceani]WGW03324.1 HlyD family efflux transporter periplasmic adaptor subunit [Tropicibacter oceani]